MGSDPQIYLNMANDAHKLATFTFRVNINRFKYGTSFKNKLTYQKIYEDML
jgi:hypothetical protein